MRLSTLRKTCVGLTRSRCLSGRRSREMNLPMVDPTTGTVSIGDESRTLPLMEARDLFLAAGVARRKGIPIAIDAHTMIAPGLSTAITFTATGGFTDEYNPSAFLGAHGRRRTR